MKKSKLFLSFLLLILLIASPALAGEVEMREVEMRDYVVKKGDSLTKIAKNLGAKDWKKQIWLPNKDKIPIPRLIYPGQKLIVLIPLKRETALLVNEDESKRKEVIIAPPQAKKEKREEEAPKSVPASRDEKERFHHVKSGDSFYSLGKKHHIPPRQIWEKNRDRLGLKRAEDLSIGHKLIIPTKKNDQKRNVLAKPPSIAERKKILDEKAKKYGVSFFDLYAVLWIESRLGEGIGNGDGYKSFGPAQINLAVHFDVSYKQALDFNFATEWCAKRLIKLGYLVNPDQAIMYYRGKKNCLGARAYLKKARHISNKLKNDPSNFEKNIYISLKKYKSPIYSARKSEQENNLRARAPDIHNFCKQNPDLQEQTRRTMREQELRICHFFAKNKSTRTVPKHTKPGVLHSWLFFL